MSYKEFRLAEATVLIFTDECLVITRFDDGTEVIARPNYDERSVDTAKSLGYESVEQMTREHDVLHSFLAAKTGMRFSPTLWWAAHNESDHPMLRAIIQEEEEMVLAFQRYLNDGTYHYSMDYLLQLPGGLDKLKAEAIQLFRG